MSYEFTKQDAPLDRASWPEWPTAQRDADTEMGPAFWQAWRGRLHASRFSSSLRWTGDYTLNGAVGYETDGSGVLFIVDELWIPPWAQYLRTRWKMRIVSPSEHIQVISMISGILFNYIGSSAGGVHSYAQQEANRIETRSSEDETETVTIWRKISESERGTTVNLSLAWYRRLDDLRVPGIGTGNTAGSSIRIWSDNLSRAWVGVDPYPETEEV